MIAKTPVVIVVVIVDNTATPPQCLPLFSGLVVPQVNTVEDAQNVVASTKFPPYGFRGQGSPFPGIAHGVDIATYVRTANETVMICLQIESKEGVQNVDAICAVPGVGE